MIWPYQALGIRTNPPICLLHGFLGGGEDWLRIAKILRNKFYCVLPDLPGHGKNTNLLLDSPLSFNSLNAGLLALLDSLDIQQTHLVGYSMGGRAALYFAVHHPERVASLTLESASPGMTDPDERRARAEEDDQRAEAILAVGVESFVEDWYTLPLFRSLHALPEVRAQTIARRKANHSGWMAKVVSDLSPGRQPPVWDQLPHLEMPVLLIAGSLDEKYIMLGEQMAARIPQVRVAVAPDAGHAVHLEQPEQFAQLLQDFLQGADKISNI
jgi:2-succinyl-6-hydroxy-2,4-cyclohexadiene-1-carboxylate synthase